jgi:hypothetical protein
VARFEVYRGMSRDIDVVGDSGAAAFRTAFAARSLPSYRHLAQLRTLVGHSRITITIAHYGHIFPLIDTSIEIAVLGDATAAEWAHLAALTHDNFRQLRSRHPAGGVTVAKDVARVLHHARIPRRLRPNTSPDPWQPPRMLRARAHQLTPDVLARFLTRLADGMAWRPLVQSFGLTQKQQCGLVDGLLMLHERAPQAWYRKEQLISIAAACGDPALLHDVHLLRERPFLGLPRRRLKSALIARVWERQTVPMDPVSAATQRIAEPIAYATDRRQRLIPLSSPDALVEVASILLSLGINPNCLVVLYARNYPLRRVQTALERLGAEGAGIHVTPTQRISESSVGPCIAIAMRPRQKASQRPMRTHVDTLAWALGVLALCNAVNTSPSAHSVRVDHAF